MYLQDNTPNNKLKETVCDSSRDDEQMLTDTTYEQLTCSAGATMNMYSKQLSQIIKSGNFNATNPVSLKFVQYLIKSIIFLHHRSIFNEENNEENNEEK